jgi:hypothetical protein
VRPKNIGFPTDAKLLHAAIKGLNRLANKHGVQLRQSCLRVAKRAAMTAGRYAHAKQFNRQRRELRILRTRLGRLIRDIGRKIAGQGSVEAAFALPLARTFQIRSQQQHQRGWKLYSHAPETEWIGKGNASASYEFGVKVSIVTTNARAPGGQFELHAKALPGNAYDGHTLRDILDDQPKNSPAARSNGAMSTRDTADTMRKIHAASSSRARSAACPRVAQGSLAPIPDRDPAPLDQPINPSFRLLNGRLKSSPASYQSGVCCLRPGFAS